MINILNLIDSILTIILAPIYLPQNLFKHLFLKLSSLTFHQNQLSNVTLFIFVREIFIIKQKRLRKWVIILDFFDWKEFGSFVKYIS